MLLFLQGVLFLGFCLFPLLFFFWCFFCFSLLGSKQIPQTIEVSLNNQADALSVEAILGEVAVVGLVIHPDG